MAHSRGGIHPTSPAMRSCGRGTRRRWTRVRDADVRADKPPNMRVDDPSVGYCLGTGGDAAAETAVADRGSAVASSSTFIAAGRPAVVAAIVLVAAVGLMACRPGGDDGGDAGGSGDTGAAARQAPADCDPARPAAA